MLDQLTLDDFQDKLHQSFSVQRGADLPPISLTLIQAEEHPARAPAAGLRSRPFSMLVVSSLQTVLQQGTYPVEVPGLGTLDLFIVPVGPSAQSNVMRYQILFN
jgi:hypothetical protein